LFASLPANFCCIRSHDILLRFSFLKNSGRMFLLAFRTMTAAVVITLGRMAGPTAAGIAKFQRGCAGFKVAGGVRAMPVLLATCAGMQGGGFILIVGLRYLESAYGDIGLKA
jgi:hypothetical protein